MNIFTGTRKRKTLGTIPVELNLKEGTMKVSRSEALATSRQVLDAAERERQEEFLDKDSLRVGPRQEDKMELKPSGEMDASEAWLECKKRLQIDNNNCTFQEVVKALREKNIGTENLAPPEPEWKRERVWPDEEPVDRSKVRVYRSWRNDIPFKGEYVAYAKSVVNFKGSSFEMMGNKRIWCYLEEPRTWKNVERDGEPSEEGWFEVERSGRKCREFAYYRHLGWFRDSGGHSTLLTDVIAYCDIAPAPEYKEASDD